jgi:hypothetical protein
MHYAELYCQRSCRRGMMHHSKIFSPVFTQLRRLSLQIYSMTTAIHLKKSVKVSSNLQHTYFLNSFFAILQTSLVSSCNYCASICKPNHSRLHKDRIYFSLFFVHYSLQPLKYARHVIVWDLNDVYASHFKVGFPVPCRMNRTLDVQNARVAYWSLVHWYITFRFDFND